MAFSARPFSRRRLGLVAGLIGLALGAATASAAADEAAELRALKNEIAAERAALAEEREALREQRERVDDALRQLQDSQVRGVATAPGGAGAPAGALPAVGAEKPGPRIDVYGFAHTDAIYDFDRVDPDWNDTLRASKIPVNCPGGAADDPGCGEDGETILSVRQSRLGFRGYFPTKLGELKTIFEFELFGVGDDAGETTFRLRHAWGELGDFGAGQTWSLFMDPDVFPNTVDYWGPAGMVFLRNPQIRWAPSAVASENFSVALALEAPGSGIDEGKVTQIDPGLDADAWNSYPDLTAQLRWMGDWGHTQLAGIARGLGTEGETSAGDDFRFRNLGWGVNLSSVLDLGILADAAQEDALLMQIVYGEGIANYMNDGGSDIAPDHLPPGTEAEAVPTLGWLLYYNRTWNPRWTSSFGYGEHRQDTTSGQSDDAFERGQLAQANLLFHPIPAFYVGPEFIWGRRKNKDGETGTDRRFQLSFHYNFGATLYDGR
jgi:hypothetical protein